MLLRLTMVLALGAPSLAWAQAPANSGFDAHGFRLAAHDADARDPLVVPRAGAFDAQSWFAGGVIEYANQPLVFVPAGEAAVVELDNLLAANVSAGYAPHERVRLDLGVPLFLYGEGKDGPVGAGLGDVRATGTLSLVAPRDGGLGLAFFGNVDVPTGRPEVWLGQFTLAGGFGVGMTYEAERLTVTGSASSQIRPNTDPDVRPTPTRGGDAFTWGGGIGYLIAERTGLNLEIHGEVPVDPDVYAAVGTPSEALMSVRMARENGGFLTAGLGTALTRGAGASPLRLLVGGGFGKGMASKDTDGDGLPDSVDACPDVPETVNGFKDDDGCKDALPTLTLRAVGPAGKRLENAGLMIEGPVTTDGIGEVSVTGAEVVPGSQWTLFGRRGTCLSGRSEVTLGEESLEVDLELQPVREGRLRIEVVDGEGAPIPNATARIRGVEKACFPKGRQSLEGGTGEIEVGEGTFRVLVDAEGFAVKMTELEFEAGAEQTLRVELRPAKVKVTGTEIQILEKVYFATATDRIQDRSFEVLDQVAEAIIALDLQKVEIGGHTDDVGDAVMNGQLSKRRAESVQAYLTGKGVLPERLSAVGYGMDRPVAEGTSKEARALNRRVEFKILEGAPE